MTNYTILPLKESKPKDGVRGTIHNHDIENLEDLTTSTSKVHKSMKTLHQMISNHKPNIPNPQQEILLLLLLL